MKVFRIFPQLRILVIMKIDKTVANINYLDTLTMSDRSIYFIIFYGINYGPYIRYTIRAYIKLEDVLFFRLTHFYESVANSVMLWCACI